MIYFRCIKTDTAVPSVQSSVVPYCSPPFLECVFQPQTYFSLKIELQDPKVLWHYVIILVHKIHFLTSQMTLQTVCCLISIEPLMLDLQAFKHMKTHPPTHTTFEIHQLCVRIWPSYVFEEIVTQFLECGIVMYSVLKEGLVIDNF